MDNNTPQQRSRFRSWMKAHPVAATVTVILAVLVGLPVILITGLSIASHISAAPMESVADRFHPPQGWVKEGENITPRFGLAIDTEPGTMWRSWIVSQKVEDVDLEGLAKAAGYTITSGKQCAYPTARYTSSGLPSCIVFASRDGITVTLEASGYEDSQSRFSLNLADDPQNLEYKKLTYQQKDPDPMPTPVPGAGAGTGVQVCILQLSPSAPADDTQPSSNCTLPSAEPSAPVR